MVEGVDYIECVLLLYRMCSLTLGVDSTDTNVLSFSGVDVGVVEGVVTL